MNNNFNINNHGANQHVNTTVKGFCFAAENDLDHIKQVLGLKSDIKVLKRAQKYFADTEGRDPSEEELKLIDRIALEEPRKASEHFLTELFAECFYIGESFDDLKGKLSALGKVPPYSFDDIALAGELCCNEFCKEKKNAPIYMCSGDSALLNAAPSGNLSTALIQSKLGGNCAIFTQDSRSLYSNAPVIENSDSIIFVSSLGDPDAAERFVPMLSGMLINLRSKINLKAATVIQNGNLLDAVLSLVHGCFINLSALPGMIYNPESASLLDSFDNGAIVILSSTSTPEFLSAAKAQGFGVFLFGHPNNTNKLTISTGIGHPLSLSTVFLNEIRQQACLSVSVKKPSLKNLTAPSIDFSVMGFANSFFASYVAQYSNLLVTNAKKVCHSYSDAIGLVLEAVSRLVSSGVDRRDITASFDITVNTLADKETLGESLAMLLGLYRAQTELSLVSVGSACRVSCTPSIVATLAAPQPTKIIPNTFSSSGSRVYLLSPRSDENGIPNFKDMRLLFGYIEELKKYGLILSARAVEGKGAIETAKKMQNENVTLNLTAENAFSSYGALIIESKNELQGTFLGFTE